MLTRAISAPAQYGAPGILRYSPESLSPVNSNVKFAPLPQTEVFGRRARFSSRLGVQGRSGILNKQRQHPNGINYDPNNAIQESAEPASIDDASSEPNGHDAAHGTTPQQASETITLHPPESDPSLNLRRSASEDGTAATSTSKRGGSFKFWKKPSKRPALSTIPSEAVTQHPDPHVPEPQTTETADLVGPCGVPAAPLKISTTPGLAESSQETKVETRDAADTTATAPEGSNMTPTPPAITISLHSPAVSTSSVDSTNATLNAATETPTEEYPERTGVRLDSPSDGPVKSETHEPLEVSIRMSDEKVTPPITPL